MSPNAGAAALGGEQCAPLALRGCWLCTSVVVSLREYAYGVSCETTPPPLACKYG